MPSYLITLALLFSLVACTEPRESNEGPLADEQPAPEVVSDPAGPGTPTPVVSSDPIDDDQCGASKVEPFIGQQATVPVRIEVAKAAGASSDRWIYPDSVVTQDRRIDRLNVVMEKDTDIITSAHCG